jgi:SOS response regulatory protein OraA/RecX
MSEAEKRVVDRILKLIERNDRFEGEIRHAFRDEEPTLFDSALARLRAYLDDRRAIESYLRSRQGRKAIGRERMREELEGRFAPRDLVEEAFADLPSEVERVTELLRAERKARTHAQAGRFLFSRGFDEDAVETALSRHFIDGNASE